VRQLLGGREDYITSSGRDKVCNLTAKQDEQIFKNGVRVFASWKYSTCRSGIEPVVQDVCCNRKCSCKIVSQDVTPIDSPLTANSQKELVDLTSLLPPKEISYYCSLSEMAQCKKDCLEQSANYFNNRNIVNLYPKRQNLNVFSDQVAANKVCQLVGDQVTKPGTDIFSEMKVDLPNVTDEYVCK
jgi:hypothetical protein